MSVRLKMIKNKPETFYKHHFYIYWKCKNLKTDVIKQQLSGSEPRVWLSGCYRDVLLMFTLIHRYCSLGLWLCVVLLRLQHVFTLSFSEPDLVPGPRPQTWTRVALSSSSRAAQSSQWAGVSEDVVQCGRGCGAAGVGPGGGGRGFCTGIDQVWAVQVGTGSVWAGTSCRLQPEAPDQQQTDASTWSWRRKRKDPINIRRLYFVFTTHRVSS